MSDISPLSDPINTDSTRIYSDNDGDEDVNMYIDEYVDKNIDKDGDENAINIDECRNEDVSNIDEFREVGPVDEDKNGDENAINIDESRNKDVSNKNELFRKDGPIDEDKNGDENAMNIDESTNKDVSNIDEFREVWPVDEDKNGDENAINIDESRNKDVSNKNELFRKDGPIDKKKLHKTITIVDESIFCTSLEILNALDPKGLIEQLKGCIELIHKHPDPQLDVMTMLVFQYLHLLTVTDSVDKVAKKYVRSFKSIIRDKNHEREILKCTTDAAIKLFCKDKFKVELWKETFIAIRKKLETEERIDILQFIKYFFDIVGRIDEDEEEKLKSEMKKQEIALRTESDKDFHNTFIECMKKDICSGTVISKGDFKRSFRNLRPKISSCKPKENVNNAEKKTSATSFSSFLKQNSFLLGERDHDKHFKSLFASFLKGNGMSFDGAEIDFGKFYNFEDSFYECSYPFVKELQHGSNSFTTVISSQPTSSKAEENTKKGSAPILQAQYSDISSPSSLGSSQHEFKSSEANQTEQKRAEIDFGKFHNFKDSFYECSYPFVKELQHGSNSFTTVISSQPTSSKAEENTKKGSAPILQAQYSDISSPSSPGSSQHEFNSSEANQTEEETTKILEEMSLPEIKDYFSKNSSKLKEFHLLTVNNEDIVSASDATDLYVVCGFQSSLIRVWNISSEWWINGMKFDEHCILRGHKGTVNSVEINSELQRLISGSCDKTVRIWDLEMRTCLSEHVWHSKAVYGVCWSPTSKCFLSSSADGTAVLHWYNEIKPTTVYTHNSKTDVPIFVVRFHPNGMYFATAAADGTVGLWTIDQNTSFVRRFYNNGIKVKTISFSPCGKFLAAGDKAGWISVLEISKNKLVKHFKANASGIKQLSYNKRGNAIAAIFVDASPCIFYPDSKREKVIFLKCSTETATRYAHFIKGNELLLIENLKCMERMITFF